MADKLVLGFIVLLATTYFAARTTRDEKVIDYQKTLFDSRLKAYELLLKSAKESYDNALIYYIPADGATTTRDGEHVWQARFGAAQTKLTGWSAGSSWRTHEDMLASLEKVETVRREHELYLSSAVSKALDEFLDSMLRDVEECIQRCRGEDSGDKTGSREFQQGARDKAAVVYRKLREQILNSLRFRNIILG